MKRKNALKEFQRRYDKTGGGFFGRLRHKIKIVGDIESPLDPPEVWECMRDDDEEEKPRSGEDPH